DSEFSHKRRASGVLGIGRAAIVRREAPPWWWCKACLLARVPAVIGSTIGASGRMKINQLDDADERVRAQRIRLNLRHGSAISSCASSYVEASIYAGCRLDV